MHNKNIYIVFLFIFFLQNTFCQEFSKSINPDKINFLLKEKANEIRALKGEFNQTKLISSLGMEVISKGNFQYKKNGKKILWEYSSPTQFVVLFLNNEIHIKQTENTTGSSIKENSLFKAINSVVINSISGNIDDIEGFDKEFLESDKKILVKLSPLTSELKKSIVKLEIYFSKLDYSVSEVKIHEIGNDITSISFTNLMINPAISDSLFIP